MYAWDDPVCGETISELGEEGNPHPTSEVQLD
jgi:hypothetical protein